MPKTTIETEDLNTITTEPVGKQILLTIEQPSYEPRTSILTRSEAIELNVNLLQHILSAT